MPARRSSNATLHLMCGLPGSGKTTLARRLEQERKALRLTPDEWITRLFGSQLSLPTLDWCRDPVESVQWDVAERALSLGIDVVLDFGVWSRSERERFRARAAGLGAGSEIHFLDVPLEVLEARLATRNADLPPHTFPVTKTQLMLYSGLFEPPSAGELVPRKVVNRGLPG